MIGGIICNSRVSNTKCDIGQTLYAANFGIGNYVSGGRDSRNISFCDYGGKSEFTDPNGLWAEGAALHQIIKGVPQQDKFLYPGYMWSNANFEGARCTSLVLKLAGDGNYEVSFRTGEFAHMSTRVYSILMNGQYLVEDFEMRAYREFGFGLELNANFKISQFETMIEIQGHPVRALLQQGKVEISPCTSKCERWFRDGDIHYTFNAISVVKFVTQ